MKFVVVQVGARRAYAVPAILEGAGMLERFYTNAAGNVGLGSIGSIIARPFFRESATRLAGRKIPGSIRNKTSTFATPALMLGLRRPQSQREPAAAFLASVRYSEALGRAMIKKGFGKGTHIYSMLGECGPLLAAAKRRGLKVVSEVYILLSTERIMKEERKLFPDWEPDFPDFAAVRKEAKIEDYLLRYSDFFICPSKAVQSDLVDHFKVSKRQTAVVPYGVSETWFSLQNQPIKRRILFAGTAELRKGIHYFAIAASKLKCKHAQYEFRVAGNVRFSIARQPQCKNLTFLGRLSRAEMEDELQSADVFVLPSLAEGSAEAIYEALAAGIPVVTTSASGSAVRDGIEGRIVPERDSDSLAVAIEEIVEGRETRDRMAQAARKRARNFSWVRYGERLVSVLRRLE